MAVADDIERLRQEMHEVKMSLAVREENFKNTNIRLDKIEAMIGRVTWLVVGGIISGAVAFMLSGGFSVPPIG